MFVVVAVLAGLAALLHVYIFVMESYRWEHPATLKVFGNTPQLAATTREMAFNQGYYNLFLAVITVVGLALVGISRPAAVALIAAGLGSMFAASVVLVANNPHRLRAGVTQGTMPALALLALIVWA